MLGRKASQRATKIKNKKIGGNDRRRVPLDHLDMNKKKEYCHRSQTFIHACIIALSHRHFAIPVSLPLPSLLSYVLSLIKGTSTQWLAKALLPLIPIAHRPTSQPVKSRSKQWNKEKFLQEQQQQQRTKHLLDSLYPTIQPPWRPSAYPRHCLPTP